MALDARSSLPAVSVVVPDLQDVAGARRPSTGNGGGDRAETTAAVSPVDVPAPLWSDEGRMKRELVAWARAVASMAIRESMQC